MLIIDRRPKTIKADIVDVSTELDLGRLELTTQPDGSNIEEYLVASMSGAALNHVPLAGMRVANPQNPSVSNFLEVAWDKSGKIWSQPFLQNANYHDGYGNTPGWALRGSVISIEGTWWYNQGFDTPGHVEISAGGGGIAGTTYTFRQQEAEFPATISSTVDEGSPPFTILSTTVNDNLNADLLDGYHASAFAASGSNPFNQSLNTSDSPTFENVTLNGQLTLYSSGSGDVTSGQQLYYPFVSSAEPIPDASGNGRNGTNYGATWNASGKWTGCYDFNGSSDYIQAPATAFNPAYGDFTVCLWAKTSTTGQYGGLISNYNGGASPGTFWIFVFSNNSVYANDGSGQVTAPGTLADGNWHFIVARRKSGNFSLSVDTVEGAASPSAVAVGNDLFTIGSILGFPWYFAGSIDEVKVYDRGLTDGEIAQLYSGGTPAYSVGWNKGGSGVITTAAQIQTTVSGSAPLSVSDATVVTNLNADLLDGYHASHFAASGSNPFNQSLNTSDSPQFAGLTVLGIVSGSASTFSSGSFDGATLVTDTVNHRVGIGTSTPGATFAVVGNSQISGSLGISSGNALRFAGTGTAAAPLVLFDGGIPSGWYNNGYGATFAIAGTPALTISGDTGFVASAGLGTFKISDGTRAFTFRPDTGNYAAIKAARYSTTTAAGLHIYAYAVDEQPPSTHYARMYLYGASGSNYSIGAAQAGGGVTYGLNSVFPSHNWMSGSTTQMSLVSGSLGVGTSSPNSTLYVSGSVGAAIRTVTGNYTAGSELTILASGALTVTLPSAATCPGRMYNVKKIDSFGTIVTVSGSSGNLIDGEGFHAINVQYATMATVSDGVAWWII